MIRKPHLEALIALRPMSEWTMSGDDYSTLVWHDKEWPAPDKTELATKRDEIAVEVEAEKKALEADRAATKKAAIDEYMKTAIISVDPIKVP